MAASLLLATATYAQTTGAATIVGNVTDTTGAVIPGAKVVVVNPLTGFTFDAVTNRATTCRICGPAFKRHIEAPGFKRICA